MVTIDRSACTGCGVCVADCPTRNLSLAEGKAAARGRCLDCGHCVALCPARAVSIPEYEMGDVEEYDPSRFALDPAALLRAVKFRRSVRDYRPRPVEGEALERVLQAGRYAATAKNLQACRFILVQEGLAELKERVWSGVGAALGAPDREANAWAAAYRRFYERRERDPEDDYLFRNAPAVLFVAAEAVLDAGLAAQCMELQAAAEGMGMLYNGYLRRACEAVGGVREWLGAGEKPLSACMLLGYPAVRYRRTAPRRKIDLVLK